MQYSVTKPPISGGFVTENDVTFATHSLSPQETRVVLALASAGRRETTREEIVELLGAGPKAADHAIESLRRKGWLEWAAGGSISSYAGRARAGRPPRQQPPCSRQTHRNPLLHRLRQSRRPLRGDNPTHRPIRSGSAEFTGRRSPLGEVRPSGEDLPR